MTEHDHRGQMRLNGENLCNHERYKRTALLYDFLDAPWERMYRTWRPHLLHDLRGQVLEAGIGTGRNLPHYPEHVHVTCLDFSQEMLHHARKRSSEACCTFSFVHDDACSMKLLHNDQFDWVVAFFLCCVIPPQMQMSVIEQIHRVLKPEGRFRLIEMVWSKNPAIRFRQQLFAPIVKRLYGAGFDRNTLEHLQQFQGLTVESTRFLKHDVYLLIEGSKTG